MAKNKNKIDWEKEYIKLMSLFIKVNGGFTVVKLVKLEEEKPDTPKLYD